MPDFRSYCLPASKEPKEITLSADESHHLVVVNRARAGDTVVVFDGQGTEWLCALESDKRQAATLTVRSVVKARPLPYEITLGQALPKGPSMEAIVRKATEIGVARIVPLESERTQVKLDEDRQDRKTGKWEMAALEAAKQCGNAWLPQILPLERAATFMETAKGYDLKLIASLHSGAKSLKTVLAAYQMAQGRMPKRVLWLIGPEGDFTAAEMSLSQSCGFEPVTLGPLVLRCETAAVYALSILSYELQNE